MGKKSIKAAESKSFILENFFNLLMHVKDYLQSYAKSQILSREFKMDVHVNSTKNQ